MTRQPAAELGFLLLIPAVAWSFFPWVANPFALKQEFALVGAGVALWYWGLRAERLGGARFAPSACALAVPLYLASAAASNLGAGNAADAWLNYSLLALGLLLFSIGHLRLWSPAFPRRFVLTVFWTSLPISLLGIAQAAVPGKLDFGLLALGRMAAFSTLGNPLFVATWLAFVLPLAPLVVREAPPGWQRWGAVAVTLAAAACLVATRSTSGLLGLAAAGVVWLALRTRGRTLRRIAVGVGLMIPAIASYLGWFTHTGRGRIMIWVETVLVWLGHPWLGVGLGQYNIHQLEAQHAFFRLGHWTERFHQNAAFVLDAHNQYLQILTEQGVLGACLFLFIVWQVLRQLRLGAAHDPLIAALGAAWCGQLALFLWNAPLFYAPVLLLFWTAAGILAPLAEPLPMGAARRTRLTPALWVSVALLLFGTRLRSGIFEKEGDALLEAGPFPAAVERFDAALRWAPQNGYAWEKLALAQYFAGDHRASLASLAVARGLFGDVGILYLEAEILTRERDYTRAIPAFEFIRDAFPQHVTPSFALGQIFREQGDYRRAEQEFVRVLSLPDSPENLKLDRKKIVIQKQLAFRFLADVRRRR